MTRGVAPIQSPRPLRPAAAVPTPTPASPTALSPHQVTLSGEAAASGAPSPLAQSYAAMGAEMQLQMAAQRIEQVEAGGGDARMQKRQLRQDYAQAQQQGPLSDATQSMVQQALGDGGAPKSAPPQGGQTAPPPSAPAASGDDAGDGGDANTAPAAENDAPAPTADDGGGGAPANDVPTGDDGGGTTNDVSDDSNNVSDNNNNSSDTSQSDGASSDDLPHDIHSQAFEDRMHDEVGEWEDDFRQGGQGNCASVAPIKAAMDWKAFGDEVFQDVQHNNDGYDVTLRDGNQVHLSEDELDAAYSNSGFVGSGDGYDYANFMYGVMAKNCQNMRGYGSIYGGFNELNNGNMFENTTNYLGIENYCQQVDPSVASEYGPAMLCSNTHAVFADVNDAGQHVIDLWGNYLNDNGTDGIGNGVRNAYAIVL